MNALILLSSMTVMGLAPNEVADLSRLRYCPCLYGHLALRAEGSRARSEFLCDIFVYLPLTMASSQKRMVHVVGAIG